MGELRQVRPMARNRAAGPEKRTALRFGTRGRLAGHLVSSNQPIFVQNVGLGGFGAELSSPLPAGTHIVRLTPNDHPATLLEARTAFCRPVTAADGTRRFHAGFEFVRPPQDVDRSIKDILQRVTNLRLGA